MKRKDLRKEILSMSIFGAVMGIVTGYLWLTYDWWKPETITGTRVGFEDLLLGFGNGGVGAVLYQFIHVGKKTKIVKPQRIQVIILIVFVLALMAFLIWGLRWTSFYASVVSMIIISIWAFVLRGDLMKASFMNGLYMTVLSIPVYLACELVSPGWIRTVWYMGKLSGIMIGPIPIEDLVFYFQAGLLSFLLYKIWNGLSINTHYKRKKL